VIFRNSSYRIAYPVTAEACVSQGEGPGKATQRLDFALEGPQRGKAATEGRKV